MNTDKKVMIGIIVILIVAIVIMLVAATVLVNKWFKYEYETVKYSKTFCDPKRFSISGKFIDENCFNDCATRCSLTGYKYKNHFESSECLYGCGCECI